MQATILTLFPEMFPGTLGHSLAGRALSSGLWSLETIQIRDFATDKHNTVDEKSYGGGTGLVMRPDVVGAAIEHALVKNPNAQLIYTTPRGVPFSQELAYKLVFRDTGLGTRSEQVGERAISAQSAAPCESTHNIIHSNEVSCPSGQETFTGANIIILCGRYEGVDQRILDKYQPLEVSLGDYVLSGGEVAAQVVLDACIRLIPGVISTGEALENESFSMPNNIIATGEDSMSERAVSLRSSAPCASQQTSAGAKLLEYPQYTQPASWQGLEVPPVLLSGNHKHIAAWRAEQALEITKKRRPDLLNSPLDSTNK